VVDIEEEIPGVPAVAKAPVVTADDGVAVLRKQLDDEIAARREADARAREAEARAAELADREYSARADQHETNISLVESAIAEMQRNAEILKAGLEEAYTTGDAKRVADITAEMQNTARKLSQLEDGYDALKNKTVEKPTPPAPSSRTQEDPVEAIAKGLSPKSAAWVRAHPEVGTDKKAFNKMIAAHHAALAEDLAVDTPEYFAHLDKVYAPPPAKVATQEAPLSAAAAPTTQRTEAPVVAPAGRGGGNGKATVTLTRAERDAAEASGLTPLEYAKNKIALQKEGKLPQTTH
jgi:hypothetical protein